MPRLARRLPHDHVRRRSMSPLDPPPTVTGVVPAAGAANVSPGANVAATFSEPVNNVNTGTFTLTDTTNSAVVNADYRMTIVRLEDGRTLNGLVVEETPQTLTLQTPTERVTLPLAEIEERKRTQLSPMPEGQLDPLADEQVRDLIAYLQSQRQVPLPAEK
jgi:putative heme-binding domain-containing protein